MILAGLLVLLYCVHINCKVTKQGWDLGQLNDNNGNKENAHQPLLEPETETMAYPKLKNSNLSPFDIPDHLDWRDKGVVTAVKSGMTSEVFTIIDMIESDLAVKTGVLVGLSIQQIFDCCSDCNKSGMFSIPAGLKYIEKFGLERETDYPLHPGKNSTCNYNPNLVVQGTKGITFKMVKQGDENDLKKICATTGPVFVIVHVLRSFELYKSGVYYSSECDPDILNHSMLLVGYGTEGGEDYWIVKNSWGSNWGEMGYAKMSRNRNDNCGIAMFAFAAEASHLN